MKARLHFSLVLLGASGLLPGASKKHHESVPSPLDQYIQEAMKTSAGPSPVAAGSIWSPSARLSDMASDLRARFTDDVVTIQVTDKASANSSGTTKTKRSSDANSSIDSLAGPKKPTGALTKLLKLSTQTQLDANGATSRATSFTTSLAARVTHVLPNGFLVVEGYKTVAINSENQLVSVRGVVRPIDLSTGNIVQSDRIAQLEVRINGKGVVGDSVRRPFFLYRLLLGLLPF